jgi:hypothetical protein
MLRRSTRLQLLLLNNGLLLLQPPCKPLIDSYPPPPPRPHTRAQTMYKIVSVNTLTRTCPP